MNIFNFKSLNTSFDVEQQQQQKELDCFEQLSYKERITGFLVCMVLGWAIQILSFGSVVGILVGDPYKFAMSFSLGNIVSLIGTFFLAGPKSQFKSMTDKSRLLTTIVFISSLVLTLISALIWKRALLVLIFSLIQLLSYIWYTATYIPFARTFIKSLCSKCFNMCLKQ